MKKIYFLALLSFFHFAVSAQSEFITTWKTNNPGISEENQITIPTYPGENYDYSVDWGDGTSDLNVVGNITHTYASAGTYQVSITGVFPRIYFNYETGNPIAADEKKLLAIEQWGNIVWSSMSGAFYGCVNMDVNATDVPNLSNVTSVQAMFRECSDLVGNSSFNDWDVSNVTDMGTMFFDAKEFNSPLNNWNVSNVQSFNSMFNGATKFNQPLNNWILISATFIGGMFSRASSFNQDIGNWDVSSVTNMGYMFSGASSFDQEIDNWDVSKVTDMRSMFQQSTSYNQNMSSWNVGKVERMDAMFRWATNFNQNISNWNVQSVTLMNSMFRGASSFNQNISNWEVGNVTNMSELFMDAVVFDQPIGIWDVGKVTNMASMFDGASNFDRDLGSWNIENVENVNNIFTGAKLSSKNYDSLIQGWSSIPSLKPNLVFDGGNSSFCKSFAERQALIDTKGWIITDAGEDCPFISTWKTNNPGISDSYQVTIPTFPGETYNYTIDWGDGSSNTNVTGDITHSYAAVGTYEISITGNFPRMYFNYFPVDEIKDYEKLISIDQWGDINWTSMEDAFTKCSNLDILATDTPNLSNVRNMGYMFRGCTKLIGNASFSEWDVSNITGMFGVFIDCPLFNQDISNWYVDNVTDMGSMFAGAYSFNQDISSWNVSNVIRMSGLFNRASSFNQDIGDWNVSKVNDMGYMFNSANSFNQDISNWDVSNVKRTEGMFLGNQAFNQRLDGWDVSNVTSMAVMFYDAPLFNQDIGEWDVSSVTDMARMFGRAFSFDQDLGNWDVSNVVDMTSILSGVTLSTKNYDSLLKGWSGLTNLQNNLVFDAGNSQYCSSDWARQAIIDTYGWTISDAGANTDCHFVTTWKTDNPGATSDDRIRIPTAPGEIYNYSVDWGDGNSDTGITGNITHQYAVPGTYTVSVYGQFPRIYFNDFYGTTQDSDKIVSIDQWGLGEWTSMDNAFTHCSNLDVLATDIPYLEKVSSAIGMFRFCEALVGNDSFSDWKVGSITNFGNMFDGASLFNQDIGDWDVSNATYLSFMFSDAINFNSDISNWDIGNVEFIDGMFVGAKAFDQPVGKWEVDHLTSMHALFGGASSFNQDISSWNVGNVQHMGAMFSGATSFNQDIGNWDVSSVTSMNVMFAGAETFNQDISSWDVSAVTDMSGMFERATSFNQPLYIWDVSSVTQMAIMFVEATSYNKPLNQWDVSNVTDMSGMFGKATSFNQDISDWNMGKVTSIGGMFNGASSFDQNLGKWDVSMVTTMDHLFSGGGLSLENYDKTLIGWSNIPVLQSNVLLFMNNSQYCDGELARQSLIDNYGWIITDGGKVPYCNEDNDLDGVLDQYDLCLSTRPGIEVNSNGCDIVPSDGVKVYALTPSCTGSNDGSIEISMNETEYLLDISISGEGIFNQFKSVASHEPFKIDQLPVGSYTVTIAIPEILFQQTYGVAINGLTSVSGKREALDLTARTVSYNVSGSKKYEVLVNGQLMNFTFDDLGDQTIFIDGLSGKTDVSIFGESDCQGHITDSFYIGDSIQVFPTISSDYIHLLSKGNFLNVMIFNLEGKLIKVTDYQQQTNILDISSLESGLYILKIRTDNTEESIKIIKK
ncbi:BspA family leucine-rich repeat surface protein [Arenibacter sp. M-2]|uniref:BspA family leucine-rich repeat surface protein n=1 Tax=Arenibacter sp. M-2 TaxID=3053612 RepID=UPI00257117EC|nr:BspA family leucine-rich repeat surface protein [Arenibacter sp. M-2]MDL5514291.1 BspA family leucine-rich repeat surface protein [Arenibacter sp. M-2]